MTEPFLPDIDIRIGSLRPHDSHSIHSLGRQGKSKKNKNQKIQMIKQSILAPIATPLHKLIRVSLSNKTVVFKKKMLTEQRADHLDIVPLLCHQTNKIVIFNQSPRLKSQSSHQSSSGLKGCKSLLNTKLRDKKLSFQMYRKGSFNQRFRNQEEEDSSFNTSVNQKIGVCEKDERHREDFDLCPWDNEIHAFQIKKIKNQKYLKPIKRCL